MLTASFPPLQSCCVYDKQAACDRTGSQRRVELTDPHTAAGCSHQASASEGTCREEVIDTGKLKVLFSICIPFNLQITARENVRGQHCKAQGEVWELHQTGTFLDLCLMYQWICFFLLSISNLNIDLPLTVQQETGREWCQLTGGERWSQWTGKVTLLTGFVYYRLMWQSETSSGCL